MKLSRCEEVESRFVRDSESSNIEMRALSVLQDINMTLAMMYDKFFPMVVDETELQSKSEEHIRNEETESPKANLLHYNTLISMRKPSKMYIEFKEPQGFIYEVELDEIISADKSIFIVFRAFEDCIKKSITEYDYSWRCWDRMPTDEQRKAMPWNEKKRMLLDMFRTF